MHQYFRHLHLNQGPQATDFVLACAIRRQSSCSRHSQLIVSANHAQGQLQKLHKQQTAPKQSLPAEERKLATPVPTLPKPNVSASDRTLNVIVRVRALHIYANTSTSSVSDATVSDPPVPAVLVCSVLWASADLGSALQHALSMWWEQNEATLDLPCTGSRWTPRNRSSFCTTTLEGNSSRGQTGHSCTRQPDQRRLPSHGFSYLPS